MGNRTDAYDLGPTLEQVDKNYNQINNIGALVEDLERGKVGALTRCVKNLDRKFPGVLDFYNLCRK